MSKQKRSSLKNFTLVLSLTLIVTLSFIGISYGSWNDQLQMDVTTETAEFAPQIEVYRIDRERVNLLGGDATFTLANPIRPDANGVITVRVGRSSDDPIPSWIPALRNDKYRIYYRVINDSSIPLDFSTITENLTTEQQNYVAVSPADWTGVGANAITENNYVTVNIRYQPEIKVFGKIIQEGINPFDLPLLGSQNLEKTFSKVRVKQFNATTGDTGWFKNVEIGIFTNDLY